MFCFPLTISCVSTSHATSLKNECHLTVFIISQILKISICGPDPNLIQAILSCFPSTLMLPPTTLKKKNRMSAVELTFQEITRKVSNHNLKRVYQTMYTRWSQCMGREWTVQDAHSLLHPEVLSWNQTEVRDPRHPLMLHTCYRLKIY